MCTWKLVTVKVFQGMKVKMWNSETFSLWIKSNIQYAVAYSTLYVCFNATLQVVKCTPEGTGALCKWTKLICTMTSWQNLNNLLMFCCSLFCKHLCLWPYMELRPNIKYMWLNLQKSTMWAQFFHLCSVVTYELFILTK